MASVFAMGGDEWNPGASHLLAPPFSALPGESADAGAADDIRFDFQLQSAGDRFFYDLPLRRGLPEPATSLQIEGRLEAEGYVSGMTVHLRTGDVWHGATVSPLQANRTRVVVPLSRFRDDAGGLIDVSRADVARISIWAGEAGVTGRLTLHRVQAHRDRVAIAAPPGDAMLGRMRMLFDVAGVPYAEMDPDYAAAGDYALVVLPRVPEALSAAQLRMLRRAVRTGTRLMVFYTGSRELGGMLAIEPGAWMGADTKTGWPSFAIDRRIFPDFQGRVPHPTANVIPPAARRGAEAVAFWVDAQGRETPLPACVVSEQGAWFAHVPPLPVAPAVELIRRLVIRFVPGLADAVAVSALMANAELTAAPPPEAAEAAARIRAAVLDRQAVETLPFLCARLRDAAATDVLRQGPAAATGEVRAVWDSQTRFHSTARRERLAGRLAAAGINTLFAFVGDAVTAPGAEGLDRLVDVCHSRSLQIHAWMYALAIDERDAATRRRLAGTNRLMLAPSGEGLPWLCPSHPDNRTQLVQTAVWLARQGVDGVHLDYIRFPLATGCVCPVCRKAFETRIREKIGDWPAAVMEPGSHEEAFRLFQTEVLSGLVADVAAAIRAEHPACVVSAAVFPEIVSAAALRQAWPDWIHSGALDFVSPMAYQADATVFASQIRRAIAACGGDGRAVVAGIGTTADVPGPDAYGAALQIREGRQLGCRGFAFFSLDDFLLDSILPAIDIQAGGGQPLQERSE